MAFNLGDALKNVSNLDTGRKQIVYLPLSSLDADKGNFYELTDLDALADNISLAGLQQPILVRAGEEAGRYTIVSGHRRTAACRKLAEDDPEKWAEVPCIIETGHVSPALQQLRLIYANANTRQRTSAEISEEAKQVEELLYKLKEEGYEFPGRMRDHVAEAVGASKSKLARLKVIRDNLIPDWAGLWQENKIGESQAYELARLPEEQQQYLFAWTPEKQRGTLGQYGVTLRADALDALPDLSCGLTGTGKCDNLERMRMCIVRGNSWETKCTGCCKGCYHRVNCKYVCPRIAPDIKAEQKKIREAQKAREKAQEDAATKRALQCRGLWERFEAAREAAGIEYKDLVKDLDLYRMDTVRDAYLASPEGGAGITQQPYGYGGVENFENLIAVADALGVSTDALLGRDVPEKTGAAGIWHSGDPATVGDYIVVYAYDHDGSLQTENMWWNGHGWICWRMPLPEECIIYCWTEKPDVHAPLEDTTPGAECKTGMSGSGKCGAAAYCSEPVECCLNCDKDCSCRCGWIEEKQR